LKTLRSVGNVMAFKKLLGDPGLDVVAFPIKGHYAHKNQVTAVAKLMPILRRYRGKTSAEYCPWKTI
jgi:hypothetical protein